MTAASATPTVLTVVYAHDMRRVAEFYRRVLALEERDTAHDHVLLANAVHEVAIVRMACAGPDVIAPTLPPSREGVALKVSFLVEDLERGCAEALATGGRFKPLAAAWRWRGQLHLDGVDPEGNVVQLRQIERT